jgi:hypothetical protein
MINLKCSKATALGGNNFVVDGFIGAVQMSEDGQAWQDIKPRLVRETGGWRVDDAPYSCRILDNGERIFIPEPDTPSQYLRLPTNPLWAMLAKDVVNTPAKIDKQLLPNQIEMNTPWGKFIFRLTNTGLRFYILFREAPPRGIFKSDRLSLDVDSTLNVPSLLSEKVGLGIPRPRLIDSNEMPIERELGWELKKDQLLLDFDLTGLKFPVLLQNTTVDKSVAASTDDCNVYYSTTGPTWALSLTDTKINVGYWLASAQDYGGGCRFLAVNIPANATIGSNTYMTFEAANSDSNTVVNSGICGEQDPTAATFSTLADYQARRGTDVGGANNNNRTTARVAWDNIAAWTAGNSYNSPDISTVIQELVDDEGALTDIVLWWDDHDGRTDAVSLHARRGCSWNHATGAAPAVHIEYTTPTGWTHDLSGIANANIGKILGVGKASISKVMGTT